MEQQQHPHDVSLTTDEARLIRTLRASVGGPYLIGLSDETKHHFEAFLACLRRESLSPLIH